jgi:hypothetical protein
MYKPQVIITRQQHVGFVGYDKYADRYVTFLLWYFASVFTSERPDQLCDPAPMSDSLLG